MLKNSPIKLLGINGEENVYGQKKRLDWILDHLKKTDEIIEFGCGTGYMITLPLIGRGFDAIGVDLDLKSIKYGQSLLNLDGYDSNCLQCLDLGSLDASFDVVIASEVFEHIPDNQLGEILQIINARLNPDGLLVVTVPNGYGWFEFESFLWNKMGIAAIVEKLRLHFILADIKRILFGKNVIDEHPSTLSESPHVQRFTYSSIQRLLIRHGFKIENCTGTALFAGQISNLLFKGINPILSLNCVLGNYVPAIASGFLIACRKNP